MFETCLVMCVNLILFFSSYSAFNVSFYLLANYLFWMIWDKVQRDISSPFWSLQFIFSVILFANQLFLLYFFSLSRAVSWLQVLYFLIVVNFQKLSFFPYINWKVYKLALLLDSYFFLFFFTNLGFSCDSKNASPFHLHQIFPDGIEHILCLVAQSCTFFWLNTFVQTRTFFLLSKLAHFLTKFGFRILLGKIR